MKGPKLWNTLKLDTKGFTLKKVEKHIIIAAQLEHVDILERSSGGDRKTFLPSLVTEEKTKLNINLHLSTFLRKKFTESKL